MSELIPNLSLARLPPYKHQLANIIKLLANPYFFITDEMGAGKTYQVINAALLLAKAGIINRVIIVAPAPVRAVWFDPELGELSKWLWANFPATVTEYHGKSRTWNWAIQADMIARLPKIEFLITNYDFIRAEARLKPLLKLANSKTMLVLDESSAVKNWKSLQTKACEKLRDECGRVILLNGTPIANSPGDLYSQGHIMDPAILGCKTYFHFRSRYAKMGGWQGKQIVGWHDIDDLQRRFAPYVARNLKKDCLDLPAKIPSVTLTATLTPDTWRIYRDMREDMVATLKSGDLSAASQAIVKVIRLAQITSGFLGGIERLDEVDPDMPDYIEREGLPFEGPERTETTLPVQDIGREKLDVFLQWFEDCLSADPNSKVLAWGRFRPEVIRACNEVAEKFPQVTTGMIIGGQKAPDRTRSLHLLDPRTAPAGPVMIIGTPSTGSMGLNLTAANIVIYMSNDFSLKTRLQSEDRVHRPGQIRPVSYFDIVAVGPKGQKTVDHTVVKSLLNKENIADFTTSAWLNALIEEQED